LPTSADFDPAARRRVDASLSLGGASDVVRTGPSLSLGGADRALSAPGELVQDQLGIEPP